jgi:hypothetical protein
VTPLATLTDVMVGPLTRVKTAVDVAVMDIVNGPVWPLIT